LAKLNLADMGLDELHIGETHQIHWDSAVHEVDRDY
jgi:hypothetical protein